MQMPFERLMEYAASLGEADRDKGMGELAALAGERTYVSPAEIRASEEPAVRRALARDRGTIVSGSSG
jgi:hypothetical protein